MRKKLVTKDTVDLVPMTTEQEEKMRKRVATKDTVDLVPMTTEQEENEKESGDERHGRSRSNDDLNTTQEQIETKAEETVMNLFLKTQRAHQKKIRLKPRKRRRKYAKILYGIVKDQERRFQDQVRELRDCQDARRGETKHETCNET